MKFLVTPNSDFTSKAIITDDYTPEEVAAELHIRNIKSDLKYMGIKTPVRCYQVSNGYPLSKKYFLIN